MTYILFRKKIFILFFIIAGLIISMAVKTSAYVDATEGDTTDIRAIAVAGASDFYPYEYYNSETGKYEGVFPDILNIISENTGLDFMYVHSGSTDQQLYRSKDGGAQLVTAFYYDEQTLSDYNLEYAGDIVAYEKNGEEIKIGFAFTPYITDALKTEFLNGLETVSDEQILAILASYNMVQTKENSILWWIVAIVIAVCITVIILYTIISKQRKKAEAKRNSVTDPLTGIGNKEYFIRKFDEAAMNNHSSLYALAFIGFDIVHVNGYYGEDAAEDQLKFAANELQKKAVGSTDVIARVTGGSFVFMHVCPTVNFVSAWIEELIRNLNWYMKNYEKDYKPYFHAGVFYMQPGYRDRKHALANAQRVYQYALEKDLPYYVADVQDSVNELIRNQLKARLSSALETDEFKQYFQPIIDMRSGKIVGVEALSRWYHPDMGILNPERFVELMEEEGTIMELDLLIFEKACSILEKWEAEGCSYFISTNFTRSTISSPHLKRRIWEIAGKYKFNRSNLICEITEDCLEHNIETAASNVNSVKKMGFRIAVDDVGTGYTFFSDFITYPIDVIKIDRHIILEAEKNETGRKLFEGIVYMCKNLGFEVIAEGIETVSQYKLVNELGCDQIQGFYFYRAMPESDFDKLRLEKMTENTTAANVNMREDGSIIYRRK